jgi:hypothetical protein
LRALMIRTFSSRSACATIKTRRELDMPTVRNAVHSLMIRIMDRGRKRITEDRSGFME